MMSGKREESTGPIQPKSHITCKINPSIPHLSGQNLDVFFSKNVEKWRDKGLFSNKNRKYKPNLECARKSEPPRVNKTEVKEDVLNGAIVASDPTGKKVRHEKKRHLVQTSGVFDNMDSGPANRRLLYRSGKSADDNILNDDDNDDDDQLVDFEEDYESTTEDPTGYRNLPTMLPTLNEGKKTVYQKIQEVEAPENYNSMYMRWSDVYNTGTNVRYFDDPFTSAQFYIMHMPKYIPAVTENTENQQRIKLTKGKNSTVCAKCTTKNIPEGNIGEVQVMRNGKLRLKIGKCYFWLMKGINVGITEQVVAVEVDETQKTGSMYHIGNIKQHVTATPDFLLNPDSFTTDDLDINSTSSSSEICTETNLETDSAPDLENNAVSLHSRTLSTSDSGDLSDVN